MVHSPHRSQRCATGPEKAPTGWVPNRQLLEDVHMKRFLILICLTGTLGATGQDKKAQEKAEPPGMRHKGWIHSLAFSPDGKKLASASGDETVRLWDVTTGEELHHWVGHRKRVF